jgi:cytochrome P450 PksS
MISALVVAEEAGDKLNEGELLAMIYLLLVAGYETTVNLISSGTLALLENPEQMQRLRAEPQRMELAVEEMARYYSPIESSVPRMARCELELRGVTVARGEPMFVSFASANRDPRQFPQPDRFDIAREPNRHLGYGQGIHYCLGAPLARLESQIAIRTLLARYPELKLAAPQKQLRWRNSLILRGLESLPVVAGRA